MSGRGQFTKALAIAVAGLLIASAAADAAPRIEVLSNRADLISGGDALVRVTPAPRSVTVGGREVGASLAKREDGSAQGLITGLVVGKNVVVAHFARGARARITIRNHPIGGPIFSGKQIQPWICNTQNPPANSGTAPTVVPVGLGPPRDAQCNTPSATSYVYKSTSSGGFQAYDPDKPPADSEIARTTTDQGKTVPYIVRQEFGVQNRGIYAIATLAEPGAWNHKLLTYFGASTAPNHLQSQPSAVLDDMALSRGFMTANSSMNVNGQNTNQNVSAESLMMLKEHITERFGGIRYTIGQGCSGGSYQSMIASMYPGLLDGIQPNCSYTDLWTTAPDVVDCGLLVKYFAANPAMPWVPSIDGHKEPSNCAAWYSLFYTVQDPGRQENCKLPDEQVYDPATRPALTRCTIQDYQESIWGRRPESQWGPVEKQLGRGFANRAYGNEGIEYGRRALEAGEITPAQFVDLNEKIGGLDIDHKPQAARTAVDENTAAIAYRTSQVVDGRQLATVPIIDLRAYSESGEIHTSFYSYKTRARLDEANGTHGNQLIWTFPASEPILGVSPPPAIVEKSFLLMDGWLARIEADGSGAPLAQKVLSNKPGDATDKCFVGSPGAPAIGTPSGPVTEVQDPAQCAMLYPHYGNTRTAAGGPDTDDLIQCSLKPVDPKGFTDGQVATLRKVFPNGVCDYSKPGLGEQPSQPWITFEDGPGGRPLGPAPTSTATSCARTSALASARVRIVRGRKLRVRAPRGAKVAILRHGRRGVRKVARAARDGFYVVRVRLRGETRRFALRRSHGKLRRRPAIERRPSGCATIRSFALDRAAFGRVLPLRYRLRRAATVRVTVLRGKRVLRRGAARKVRAGRTYRLKLRAARLPRGDLRLRLTVRRGARTTTSTLIARHL